MKRLIRFLLTLSGVALIVLVAGPVASADSQKPTCTKGDARSNFEAPFEQFLTDDNRFECQYRLFFDGRTFTYCEDDVILGGVILRLEYKTMNLSRDAAIASLESIEQTVWLDGIEQPLMRTAYKDAQDPVLGHIVYQQRAFTTQLSPGTHISVMQDGPDILTVTLQILARTDAYCG